ncbi:hypothetical protein M8C21_031968, partial [Ambrosia artemisiifolia]
MPLVRVEVRNEYGLGMPELYTETNREDPKAVLDGVAVAGLVGVLRQLGYFESEVEGEESQKYVQRFFMDYKSNDLPRCVMEPYEDCHDPPRLYKLDKRHNLNNGYFTQKKKSSSRYRDVTHGAPVITHSGRTEYGSANLEETPSLDVSTFHVSEKSVIEQEIDHLTSIDSKNGSGYIECIFRPSCSTQSEDNNAKELFSDSNVQHNSYLDSASFDENIHNNDLAEDSGSKSAYITWDEKLEIIDSTSQPNESTEIPCTTEKIDTDKKEDLNSRVVDHIDFDFQDEQPRPTPTVIVRGQRDEIESETDYYMDALNTIESESENDLDCHTKRELKQYSNGNANKLDVVNKESHIDDNSMNFEFHVPEKTYLGPMSISHESHMESNGSSNNENHDLLGSTEVAGISSNSLTTPDKCKSEEVERVAETVVRSKEPNSQPLLNKPISTHESPMPSWSTSGGQTTVSNPVMFWTNGGLLGLEPSKPPDFGLPTAAGSEPVEEAKTDLTQRSRQENANNNIKSESSGQPIDGFQTSKLKLAFPGGNNNDDKSNGHMFPSFQLVPEPAVSLHEFESDSDDDTFCRSSPYASEDGHSHPSESNSEQWDSSESPRIKDHELDDAFGRISSAESVSSTHVNGVRFQSSPHGLLFDIPNLDSVKASQNQVTNNLKEPTPPPPPLPPMEWRGIKPNPDLTMEKEDDLSETFTNALNLRPTKPTPPQQPKPAPRKQDNVVESDSIMVKHKQPDWQNLHAQNGSTHTINQKVGGEREDFLEQIRTKSRNLRRVSTAPLTTTPAGPTSINVTAILEKATAIRQEAMTEKITGHTLIAIN